MKAIATGIDYIAYLPDLLRPASLAVSEGQALKRREGVEAFVDMCSKADLVDSLRKVVGLPLRSGTFEARLRSAIQSADAAFPMTGSEAELRALSAGVLLVHLDAKATWADVTALGIRAAVALRSPDDASGVLATLASQCLVHRRLSLRDRKAPVDLAPISEDVFGASIQANVVAGLAAPLQSLVRSVNKVIEATENGAAVSELRTEESEILWWSLAGWSARLDRPLSELEVGAAAIVAGVELAELVRVLPGPYAFRGLLHRMLSQGRNYEPKPIGVQDAVAAIPVAWRVLESQRARATELDDLCPMTVACTRSAELQHDSAACLRAVEHMCGISGPLAATPLDLATIVYTEVLFQRAFAAVTE